MATKKQEIFIQGKVEGLTNVDAYKRAYKTERMSRETITVEACRLAENPNVAPIILERQKIIIDEVVRDRVWDLGRIVDELAVNVVGAREDGQWSASTTAIMGIGKATGAVNDQVDVHITHTLKPGLSLEELEDRMGRLKALEASIIDGESEVVEDV